MKQKTKSRKERRERERRERRKQWTKNIQRNGGKIKNEKKKDTIRGKKGKSSEEKRKSRGSDPIKG